MKNEDIKNEFRDLQASIGLGINNYSTKLTSYPKCFSNNQHLAYDNSSIYFVDKLHLTFTTNYSSIHFSELNNYQYNSNFTYSLEEYISIKKVNSRRVDFANNYQIEVSGMTYGYIHYNHTKVKHRVQVELNNQFLYTQSSFHIIDNLNRVAQLLKLTFQNVSQYELARDSIHDLYDDFTMVYYQSNFCANQVLKAYESVPKYGKYGKNGYEQIITDKKNKDYGTAYIGRGDIQVKIYTKSNELKFHGNKDYISQIHTKHFGTTDCICRVEARIKSSVINKHGWDLFDLLNPNNHLSIFYLLVDSKLTFKDLKSKRWDKNNNDKYELVKLLPSLNGESFVKKVVVHQRPARIHNKNVDKFKVMVHSFLDGEINKDAIRGFVKSSIWENDIKLSDSRDILSKIYNKYQNPINSEVKRKQRFIDDLLISGGNKLKVAKAYWNYII